MSVSDIMSRGLVLAGPSEPVRDVVKRMHSAGVGAVLIVDSEGKLLGVFTERDLLRLIATDGSLDDPVEKHMTRNPAVARPDMPIMDAGASMVRLGVRHLPIVDETGRPVGILSLRDVCQALLGE